jgi:hypothetical protein
MKRGVVKTDKYEARIVIEISAWNVNGSLLSSIEILIGSQQLRFGRRRKDGWKYEAGTSLA